jgi:tetratricopeptide (TPR) repeat protein
MKLHLLNKYSSAGILLIGAAAVLVMIAIFTSPGEFTSAAFVLSGLICVMTGIFMLTFSQGEPFDPLLVGLLPVQGCINHCQIVSDIGISGNAYLLPPRVTGEAIVLQFNPSQVYHGSTVSVTGSFPQNGPAGVITKPSCNPLIQDLKKKNKIILPDNEENLPQLLGEIFGEIYDLAEKVSVHGHGSSEGNKIIIKFHNYRLIGGCKVIAQEFPGCCTKNPCPTCSLSGALIAEVTDKVVTLQECSLGSSFRDVTAVFLILPHVKEPQVAQGTIETFSDAIGPSEKVVAINSDATDIWNNHGNVLIEVGRYSDALVAYDKAIAINPNLYEVWNNRGIVLRKLGRYADAVASYERAITLNPDDADVWNSRGYAFHECGEYVKAVASYDMAISLNPDDADIWYNRGNALIKLNRYSEAVASFDKTIALSPEYANVQENRKNAREQQDKEINPPTPPEVNNLG